VAKKKEEKPKETPWGEVVLQQYKRLRAEASDRLKRYELIDKWVLGDDSVMYPSDRPKHKPRIMANLIEANCRAKTSLLTDQKPRWYVYGLPEVRFIDEFEKLAQTGVENLPPEAEMSKGMREAVGLQRLSQTVDVALDHVWRFNDMHTVMEQIVFLGSRRGLMIGRAYWDKDANRRGEIRNEAVDAKYVFYDRFLPRVNIEDGSTDWFIVAIRKPLAWGQKYFPDEKEHILEYTEADEDSQGDEEGEKTAKTGLYIEAYCTDNTFEEDEKDGVKTKKWKYPHGRKTVMWNNHVIYDGEIDVFPYVVREYEISPVDRMGTNDVERMISLNKDFNSKLCQISMNIALSANRQYIVNVSKLGMKLGELIQHNTEPGYMFPVKQTAKEVKDAIVELNTPLFNTELFQYLFFLPQVMEWASGLPRTVSQGMPSKKERQTKYEIGKEFEAATVRIRNTAHHVDSFIVGLGNINIKLFKMYYSKPRMVSRVNRETNALESNILEYPRDEEGHPLDYDFILTVQPESMLPVDHQSQAERDMRLFEMQALDPQSLLEGLRHPKVDQVMQRMQQMAAVLGQKPQGNTGPPTV
jgi:hypothetical protein